MKNYLTTILIGSIALASCATTQRTELYFGTDIPNGGHVTEQQWDDFRDKTITRFFPQGYTEFDATGRWKDTENGKTISEKTKVIVFAGKKTKQRSAAIDSIAQAYIHAFHQQSVMRLDVTAGMKLISAK